MQQAGSSGEQAAAIASLVKSSLAQNDAERKRARAKEALRKRDVKRRKVTAGTIVIE